MNKQTKTKNKQTNNKFLKRKKNKEKHQVQEQ
jgi:hypothetical protein